MDHLHTHTKADAQPKSYIGQAANECENYLSDKWTSLQAGARITGAVVEGACEEIKDRPLTVLGYAAAGAATAAGMAFLAPEAALCVGAAGAIMVGFELSEDIPKWCHEAVVVGNKDRVTKTDYDSAHKGLESLGAHGLDVGVASWSGGATALAARAELRCMSLSLDQPNIGMISTVGGHLSSLTSKLGAIVSPRTEEALYSGATKTVLAGTMGRHALDKPVRSWLK
jgi:hypothetical protein